MKFEPMYDYILVKKWQTTEKIGSLFVPQNDSPIVKSEVVAVGEGHFLQSGSVKPLKTKVGDTAVFNRMAATFEIEEDGEKYFLLHERDLFGIEKKE